MGPNPEKLFDQSYFNFTILQVSYIRDNSTSGFSSKSSIIEYELWKNKFPNVDKFVYDRVGLSTYICPKNTDFFIRANFNSDNYEAIQISIGKWTGINWKSPADINTVINTHYLNLALVSSYFDFDDYENPIHYYLQDMNVFILVSSLGLKSQYLVRQNQATMNDNIFLGSQGPSSELIFYSIDRKSSSYSNIDFDNAYLQIFLNLDPQVDLYQRTVYSFLDMLGFIGGIYELFRIFGHLWIGYFINKIYYSSILSKLYHINVPQIGETKNVVDNSKFIYGFNVDNTSQNNLGISKVIPKLSNSKLQEKPEVNKIEEEDKSEIEFEDFPNYRA